MTLDEIVIATNNFTDETVSAQMRLSFGNQALAIINTKLGLELPRIADSRADYTALNWGWFQRLLTPYIAYGVKMNDGSLNEADRYKQEFEEALFDFKGEAYNILDEQYINQDLMDGKITKLDPSNTIPTYMQGFR